MDDMFPGYNPKGKILRDRLWSVLVESMTITNEGEATWALKTRIQHDPDLGITKISQGAYTKEMLIRFGFYEAKPSSTPAYDQGPDSEMTEEDYPISEEEKMKMMKKYPFKEVTGCLWWLITISRCDILPATQKASKYLNKPSEKLWKWLTKILRYLKGTLEIGLVYTRPKVLKKGEDSSGPFRYVTEGRLLTGAADSSFADTEGRKTTLGYCLQFCGNLIDYSTKTSTRVLDSSTDAECTALVNFSHANSWLRDFLKETELFEVNQPTQVLEDNTSATALCGTASAKRSRHFDIAFFKMKDGIQFGDFEIEPIDTDHNYADFFTKPLRKDKFERFRDQLMGTASLQNHFDADDI